MHRRVAVINGQVDDSGRFFEHAFDYCDIFLFAAVFCEHRGGMGMFPDYDYSGSIHIKAPHNVEFCISVFCGAIVCNGIRLVVF